MENFRSNAPEYDPNQACLDPEEEARFDARLKVAAEVAKKHGYYFSILGEEQRLDYVIALADGEGEEIALLKSEVKATKATLRYNASVFGHLVSLLDRMRRAHRAASMHMDKTEQLKKPSRPSSPICIFPLSSYRTALNVPPPALLPPSRGRF